MVLFSTERAALKPSKIISNFYDAMFLSGAVLGWGSALLFAPSLDKVSKATLTTLGMSGLVCYTLNSKTSAKLRKVDACAEQAQFQSLKYHLQQEEGVSQLEAEIDATTRKVEAIINKTQPWAWEWWATRAGVQASMPPLQQLTGEAVNQPSVPAAVPMIETEFVSFEKEAPNLPLKVADDMRNTLIVGVPGSGKGLFVSNCLAHVQERGDTTVFYLDPKNDEKETGYFVGRVNKLYRLADGIVESSPDAVRAWLEECLADYEAFKVTPDKPRKLIVIDELTGLMEALEELGAKDLKWFKRKINTYVASGDSRGITLWGIGQNGHNTGVGMDGGEKSQLTPIALIFAKQVTASQGLQRADFIPADQKLNSSDIQVICQQSPIGRAIFHGGLNQWFPMPVLPNPSGYDRDNRKFVGKQPETTAAHTVVSDKPIKSVDQLMAEMIAWIQGLDELPSPQAIASKWESVSGKPPSDKLLTILLEKLGLVD